MSEAETSYKNTPVTKQYIEPGEAPKYRIIADTHYGEQVFDRQTFRNAMDDAVDEDRRIILLGDLVTSITKSDRRHSVEEHKITFAEQTDWLEKIISYYQDNIDWVFHGNHEQKLISAHGNFVEKICDRHDIKYAGFQINVRLAKQGTQGFNFYLTHGNKTFNYRAGEGRRKKINKEVRIKDLLRNICEADIYIMAHAHDGVLSTDAYELRLVNENGQRYEEKYMPEHDDKIYACVPSMLRTYQKGENYGSRSMFSPSEVGYLDIDLTKGLDVENVKLVVSNENEFVVKDSYKQRRNMGDV